MNPTHKTARTVASNIVSRWLDTGEFPDRLIPGDHPDHGFILDLVYGTVRWKRTLEWAVRAYIRHRPPARVNGALLVGAYQLLLRPDIPAYAAINETVDAARELSAHRTGGFVNAVLRAIQSDRDDLLKRIAALPLGLRYSHPDSLVDSWKMQYGADVAEALCEWDNTIPSVSITSRPDGPDVAALLSRLNDADIHAVAHPGSPEDAIQIPHGTSVGALTSQAAIQPHEFVVQDPATLNAIKLLDVQPGQRILDACAAPGGKAVQMAARLQNSGELVALEIHEDRLPRLRENLRTAKLSHLTRIVKADASDPEIAKTLGGTFDRILLDVPCSNTGVLRRRPDARWRFDPRRLKLLNQLQRKILIAIAPLLKPGGLLAYSTCSLSRRENETLLHRWLKKNPAFELVHEQLSVPTATHTDGAFAAIIRRVPVPPAETSKDEPEEVTHTEED